ncbi:MAG: nucleotidyltransferase domain-containing protein [Burkholderiaceae bacterium]
MTTNAAALQKRIDSGMEPDGSIVMLLRSELPQALAIYAFGSRVLGAARADSDLDLAVLVEYSGPT